MKRPQTDLQLQLSSSMIIIARVAVHGDNFTIAGGDFVLELRDDHLAPAADDAADGDQDPWLCSSRMILRRGFMI